MCRPHTIMLSIDEGQPPHFRWHSATCKVSGSHAFPLISSAKTLRSPRNLPSLVAYISFLYCALQTTHSKATVAYLVLVPTEGNRRWHVRAARDFFWA